MAKLSTKVKDLDRRLLVLEMSARLKRREAELDAERNASSSSKAFKAVKDFDGKVSSATLFRKRIEQQQENAMKSARALSFFDAASASQPPSHEDTE